MQYRNKFGVFALALALIAGIASTQPAHAGSLNSVYGEVVGEGEIKITPDKQSPFSAKVNAVRFGLKDDGTFSNIVTPSVGEPVAISGKWKPAANDSVDLTIVDASELKLTGAGTLSFKVVKGQRQPVHFQVTANSAAKKFKIELSFDTTGVKENYSVVWNEDKKGVKVKKQAVTEFFANPLGSGTFEITDEKTLKFSKMSFALTSDGKAAVEFTDFDKLKIDGKWNAIDSNRLAVNVKIPFGKAGQSLGARGVIFLNKDGTFDRVNLSGAVGQTSFLAKFTASKN